jgi:hypothetical protein
MNDNERSATSESNNHYQRAVEFDTYSEYVKRNRLYGFGALPEPLYNTLKEDMRVIEMLEEKLQWRSRPNTRPLVKSNG